MIGREKNPNQSEVARLIQQSIEQDKRRAEARRREIEERQREQDQFDMLLQQQQQQQQARHNSDMEDSTEVRVCVCVCVCCVCVCVCVVCTKWNQPLYLNMNRLKLPCFAHCLLADCSLFAKTRKQT